VITHPSLEDAFCARAVCTVAVSITVRSSAVIARIIAARIFVSACSIVTAPPSLVALGAKDLLVLVFVLISLIV
jgi:hypothetical protein